MRKGIHIIRALTERLENPAREVRIELREAAWAPIGRVERYSPVIVQYEANRGKPYPTWRYPLEDW